MTDTEYVHRITNLTDRDHKRLVERYEELRQEERIAVHGLQTGISQRLKSRKVMSHAPAFYHATFLLAIQLYRTAQSPRLSKRITKKEAAQIDGLQAVHANARKDRKTSVAQVLVEENYALIKILRGGNESWRCIAITLSESGVSISHTSVRNIFRKLEANGGP